MMWEEINWFIRWCHQTWLGGKSPNEMEGFMGKHEKTIKKKIYIYIEDFPFECLIAEG